MRISRRKFLEISALAGGALFLPMPLRWLGSGNVYAFYQSPTTIPLFGTALRGVGPGQIPVAAPDALPAAVTGAKHYTIDINEYQDLVVPASAGLGATTLRGYQPANPLGGGVQPQKHLGGIIVAEKGQPIQVTFRNNLPGGKHILPNDATIMGATDGNNRAATHLHGGFVPWISDGGPLTWFDPAGNHGASFLNNQVLNPTAAANTADYYYPNEQSARLLWYHDHTFGITRINAYAGIATGYIIRDNFERGLMAMGLPPFIETSVLGGTTVLELPLVIQDKIFVGPNINAIDPTWQNNVAAAAMNPGSLWYPHFYERNRWRLSGNAAGGSITNQAPPNPSIIPEFFGDTMLVNGTTFPEAHVEPRRYRLRVLNACNARFLNLQLYEDDGSPNGITLNAVTGNPTNRPFVSDLYGTGTSLPNVLQIGTEGGFLPHPVLMPTNVPFNPVTFTGSLIMAPAERSDLIIDFSKHSGKNVILYNDAAAPFPMGVPVNDYFPGFNTKGNPINALTPNGFGPNTRVLMRFKVGTSVSSSDGTLTITTASDLRSGIDPLTMPAATKTRRLTLNESFDAYGRLIQMLGTDVPLASPSAGFGRAYTDAVTENPFAGSTEIWEIYNTTADVHPMHFHLVNVQVLNRQPFQVKSLFSNGTANFTGPTVPPDLNETGWKETVRMYPGTVTRVIMTFNIPPVKIAGGGTVAVPPSPRTGGAEYVWHCHILEHEEHDMMRPLVGI